MNSSKTKSARCGMNHPHGSCSEAERCRGFLEQLKRDEIRGFIWQKTVSVGKGKTWCLDWEVWEKDGSNSYHEDKNWPKMDENALYRSLLFRKNRTEKLYINGRLALPFSENDRQMLRMIEKKLRDRKKFSLKIKNKIKKGKKA